MEDVIKRPRGRPRKSTVSTDPTTVQALDRGLQLLSLLATERRISLTEIALRAGMPSSTAHRLLATLESHQFAEFDTSSQCWKIGVEAFRVGTGFLRQVNLIEIAQTMMQTLVKNTGETANLAIPEGGSVVFISQVETSHPIRAFFNPGTRSPMHASGAGKALLAELTREEVETRLQETGLPAFTEKTITSTKDLFAELAKIQAQGWSFDDEERYDGMCCVAAPVFNAHGQAVAALSVSGPSARFSTQTITDVSAAVRQSAAQVTAALGGHRTS
ncbi:MAG: HTH-type transcriptional regulator BhcR [Burkholderiaceae bacterium]